MVHCITRVSLINWPTNLQKSWSAIAMRTVGLVDVDAVIMVKYFRDSRHEENCHFVTVMSLCADFCN
jgi:hypothetical protein